MKTVFDRAAVAVLAAAAVFGLSAGQPASAIDVGGAPYLSERSKTAIEREWSASGEACRLSFTVAVAPTGHWASRCHDKATLDDVVRMTMEKCEHMAQRLCGTVVVGSREVAYTTRRPYIRYPSEFDAMRVPFVRRASRVELRDDYARADGHRALAITRNGTWATATGRGSAEEATETALESCEEFDRNRGRCFLYSVDGVVLFTPRTNIYPDR